MARECAGCTLCCTAMPVPELDKPAGEPCPHLVESGCGIYGRPERPSRCSDFDCGWRQGLGASHERPDHVGVAVGPPMDNGDGRLWAVPRDERWRRSGFVRRIIDRVLSRGRRCHVIQGAKTSTWTPNKGGR